MSENIRQALDIGNKVSSIFYYPFIHEFTKDSFVHSFIGVLNNLFSSQVFTSIFAFECIIKLMALSKDFFLCGWNIFDLIIVSASLVDIIFELVDGLSVLRGLRLVRAHKFP